MLDDIRESMNTLDSYLKIKDAPKRSFALALTQRGISFIAIGKNRASVIDRSLMKHSYGQYLVY